MIRAQVAYPDQPIRHEDLPGVDPRERFIAPRQFLARLTMQQKIAIRTAAAASPALAVWIDELVASAEVDLDHPDTVAGLGAMQAAGLLTAEDVQRLRGLP